MIKPSAQQSPQPNPQRIDDIRKNFHREWLLIAIDSLDQKTTTPLTGHLIAHSAHQEDILKESITYKGLALVDYSEDEPPPDTAYIF